MVGRPGAKYQPMMLTLERFEDCVGALFAEQAGNLESTSFLPGPVEVSREVQEKFATRAVSHRSDSFGRLLRKVQAKLCTLTSAANVAILLGSGTLANDVVGGQLSRRQGKGLILSNGEFGERLIDHAQRWKLDFDTYRCEWGQPFDLENLSRRLECRPAWLWFVHCETSTGVLNDLMKIRSLCDAAGTEMCVDAISSIGTVELDLGGVAFATAVSGKALGAFPGLAIVFFRDPPSEHGAALPRYLDLRLYSEHEIVPFTHSSNLLAALAAALERVGKARYETLRQDSALLRQKLEEAGFDCVAPVAHASPGIVTLSLSPNISPADLAAEIGASGYSVAYNSRYLLERNWIQIALMGEYSRPRLLQLVEILKGTSPAYRGSGRERAARSASSG
jgi:aspartate aminotransferase-like enzyme